jgi:hypothetical protein
MRYLRAPCLVAYVALATPAGAQQPAQPQQAGDIIAAEIGQCSIMRANLVVENGQMKSQLVAISAEAAKLKARITELEQAVKPSDP